MKCPLCGKKTTTVWEYDTPDEYQDLIKDKAWHTWYHCKSCNHYVSKSSETPEERKEIYFKYWQEDLRHISVKDVFLNAYKGQLSLNAGRIQWLTERSPLRADMKILDIGSGYATFPYTFKKIKQDVHCVEPESTAAKFINDNLKMPCAQCFYEDYETDIKFGLVTMSNVLEHFERPVEMLKKAKRQLDDKGSIYIEVPDGIEFDYLSKEHDDFNSLHLRFFTIDSLGKTLNMAGLAFDPIAKANMRGRNNSKVQRLMAVCHS